MNKKVLLTAFALPLLVAACSSEEDVLEGNKANDQFAGIEKVDATFTTGADTRLATQWGLEEGDKVGFAWLTNDINDPSAPVALNGKAWQNHPLYAEGGSALKPKTSIYVGEYYSYLPYDESVVNVAPINFSVAEQPMVDALATTGAWDKIAAKSIWISPKWTSVSSSEAGVDKVFQIYPRKFSNGVALELAYENNALADVDASEIYDIAVSYQQSSADVSVASFKYAPTAAPYTGSDWETDGVEEWWADKNLTSSGVDDVTSTAGAITLTSDAHVATTANKGKFFFNALPANVALTATDELKLVITTTYGVITYNKALNTVAKTLTEDGYMEDFDNTAVAPGTDTWVDIDESFVNILFKNGKFEVAVDFLDAKMDGMHVENDAHLQKLLTYYKLYKTTLEPNVTLLLDADSDGEFKLSTASIDLLNTINATTQKVKLQKCTAHASYATKIIINSDENNEVRSLRRVFTTPYDVILADQDWTWSEELKEFGNVKSITNLGSINVTSPVVANGAGTAEIINAAGADITINNVTNWKIKLTNYGKITVNAGKELRAYAAEIINDATALDKFGEIDNNGVIGVVAGTTGKVHNYGYIKNNAGAKTYVTTNELGGNFTAAFAAATNKIGVIELTTATDNISVSNATAEGFIKYTWDPTEDGVYVTPSDDVKYNYLIVKNSIAFTTHPAEIKYLEVAGTEEVVITTKVANAAGGFNEATVANRIGFILNEGAKANVKEGNTLFAKAAYLKGTIYVGGNFAYNTTLVTYLGGATTDTDNIIVY